MPATNSSPSTAASSARAKLRFLGHAAFMVTAPSGLRVLIDPFQNPRGRPLWFKRRFPPMRANVLAVTHDHFDHNAARAVRGVPAVLKSQGSLRLMDVAVRAIRDRHTPGSDLDNYIITVECAGVRFCHLGDNRPDVASTALEAAGQVDVLMAPVDDSCHLLTFKEVSQLIDAFNPRVIVPMHYYIEGLTTEESTLQYIDGWLATLSGVLPVRRTGESEVSVSPDALPPPGARALWVMDAALARVRSV